MNHLSMCVQTHSKGHKERKKSTATSNEKDRQLDLARWFHEVGGPWLKGAKRKRA